MSANPPPPYTPRPETKYPEYPPPHHTGYPPPHHTGYPPPRHPGHPPPRHPVRPPPHHTVYAATEHTVYPRPMQGSRTVTVIQSHPSRTIFVEDRSVNHLLHFIIFLFFPVWIFVWIYCCLRD
ncbi:hypothetical protein EGW08_014816 [Elysia chlorotica]|uniref:Uncharacterized protein n=1 Tax=Elysia chlorotica TaxID=188477 RepID=A0A433T7D5_ELYCH|nr:hypothetical protein EGW08_014816 [Elysia chlorotica]